MFTLDLNKIDYKNYKKKENESPEYINLKQNISRAWNYIKMTHNLKNGECVCIRALAQATNEWDTYAIPKELIIFNYGYDSYKEFEKFIISKVKSKRIYNFYYNIYNINIRRALETTKEKEGGMFGKSCNVGSTSIIILDFDDFSHSDYLKLKSDLINKGLKTLDVMSGHGYHIIFRLRENSEDEYLLLKLIKIFQENGYTPDVKCQDAARIMRLPFFFNIKKNYDTSILAEIISGEYYSETYTVEGIFEKLGFDYNTFDLDQYYQKKKTERKKHKKEETVFVENEINLYEYYKDFNFCVDMLPIGIKNMLRGFKKGYSNLQTFTLTIFFKRMGLDIDTIKEIIEKVENINGNKWNVWSASDEAERFFDNYDYMSKYILMDLENVFGEIKITYDEEMFKIPMNVMKPNELKLYSYLLINKNSKKKTLIEEVGLSNNTIDKIVKGSHFINVQDRKYNISADANFDNFIYVNREFLAKNLKLSSNEFSVFCYLYYRIGMKNEIRTSIQSIKNSCLISEKTITTTIKFLELHKKITVLRDKYNYITDKRESNLYQFL